VRRKWSVGILVELHGSGSKHLALGYKLGPANCARGGFALLCFESTIAAEALHPLPRAIESSLAAGSKAVGSSYQARPNTLPKGASRVGSCCPARLKAHPLGLDEFSANLTLGLDVSATNSRLGPDASRPTTNTSTPNLTVTICQLSS